MIFKGLNKTKIGKINELIKTFNEKDELFYEHDKLVNSEKALAHEKEKNKILSKELVNYDSSISS
jgi:hypothetical protein